MYGGEWESKLFADLPILYPQDYKIWKEQPENARPTGGEAYTEVQARILDFVNKIAKEDDGKTVVIATHGGIIKSFRCAVKGVPLKEMNSVPFAVNASVLEIDCDGKTFTERGEYSDYLKDLQTEMPKGI